MENNSRLLAAALEEYQAALDRQAAVLRAELEPLKRSWAAFSAVYEGTAAEHFRTGWLRAEQMIEDYLAAAARLAPVLNERLAALQSADRPGDSLP